MDMLKCPYFGGITQQGRSYLIKCGKDYLSFGAKDAADNKVSTVCDNDTGNCRPFLFRKLAEMGAGPTSEWSTETLRTEYLKRKGNSEGGTKMSDIITTTEEVKPLRSHVVIATEINSIKEQTRKIVLFNAIEIGRRLVEAKEVVAHGEWANWLRDSVDFSQSTANNMMRLFEEYGANQMSLFDVNLKSQTFGNLSYSQAVLLLAIPEDEREEFVKENDVENMSVRELDTVIKEKQELEKKLKQVELEKKDTEESLLDIEGSLHDKIRENSELQEELEKERQRTKDEVSRLAGLLEEARCSGASDEKVKELEQQLTAANDSLVKTDDDLDAANKKIEELERKLKEKPIEVPVTTTIEVVPDDIQKELDELREKNKQLEAKAGQSPTIKKFEVCFETLTTSFSNLLGALTAVRGTDEEEHEKYKNAVKKLIGIMSERLA